MAESYDAEDIGIIVKHEQHPGESTTVSVWKHRAEYRNTQTDTLPQHPLSNTDNLETSSISGELPRFQTAKPFADKPSVFTSFDPATNQSAFTDASIRAIAETSPASYPPLSEGVHVDVAVVGGGITGLTTGLLLQQAGYDVAVLDAHAIGYGVSGFNSGHLTTLLLDSTYRQIVTSFGEEATRTVAQGVTEAIQLIERLIQDFRIECDFRRIPGYLYADHATQLRTLEEEYQAISKAGIPCNRTSYVPLPYEIEEAILVPDQARIDPLKYVQGLAKAFQQQGGRIFEHSRVLDIQSATFDPHNPHGLQISTVSGEVLAEDVVLATHTPIGFRPILQSRLEPMRSYIIGIRTEDMPNDALYWDMHEPYHYIRLTEDEIGPLILIGGEDHKPGEISNPEACFRRLELFAAERFAVRSVDYHWSAQFFDSADGLPYIGKSGDLYIATGLSGEGLTYGTLAARMITDQICGIHHACQDILSPARTKPLASASGMLSEGLHAMSHFIRDRLRKPDVDEPAHVPVGEGAICQIEGKKVAVYHTPDGELHLLSPVCTHMNCIVGWNPVEKSWDCPCHGGRFDPRGQVLNGPPVRDLAAIEIQESKPKT